MVFAYNPSIPDVFHSDPPALESVSSSDIVRMNLKALHAVRSEFQKCESSEKMRALRCNIWETKVTSLQNGGKVFYKRIDSNAWHGPGVVIGRDGKVVLVRHGGTYVRVHVCRLVGALTEDDSAVEESLNLSGKSDKGIEDKGSRQLQAYPPVEDDIDANEEARLDEIVSEERNEISKERTVPVIEDPVNSVNSDPSNEHVSKEQQPATITVGQRFRGVNANTGEVISGKVLSRAGKSTGRYKTCYNLRYDSDGNVGWIDLRDFNEWCALPGSAEMLVMFNTDEVLAAKEKEIANWRANEVFEEVNTGQRVISVRWVITEKSKGCENIIKARLVARGFEEDSFALQTGSPTCSKESVRLAISLASVKRWPCHTVDIKAAYLQGNAIERDVYLEPPPEYFEGKLWKLRKTVYGLCDAARAWYLRVKSELLALSVKICPYYPSLFTWHNGDGLQGICVYVNDFLWAGTKLFENMIIKKLCSLFLIGSTASSSFKYIGLNIASSGNCITVDQLEYARSVKAINVNFRRAQNKSNEISAQEKTEYRALLGQLNWLATHTRPDIAFDACELSVSLKKATIGDMLRLNKLVSRVKSDSWCLSFPRLQSVDSCYLECFSDASFANLPDGSSQGGFIIFIKDEAGNRNPVCWQTKKVRRVVKSTLSAETLALLECAETAVYIAGIWKYVTRVEIGVHCFIDNKSLYDVLQSAKMVDDRRLRIDLAVIRDMTEKREITSISWVDTSLQLADCLTKRGASTASLRAAVCGEL